MLTGKHTVKKLVNTLTHYRLLRIAFSAVSCSIGLVLVVFYFGNSYEIGQWSLFKRAILLDVGLLLVVLALLPWLLIRKKSPLTTLLSGCFAALLLLVPVFGKIILPAASTAESVRFVQSDGQLITDSSSNGIIEVGFSYPIFTPDISLENSSSFSRDFSVYFRLVDRSGDTWLYRAVREETEGIGLSVEASVQGLLSRNDSYVFLPLKLAPNESLSGRVAFVITHLDEGNSFTQALAESQSAALELRTVSGTTSASQANQTGEILASIDVK